MLLRLQPLLRVFVPDFVNHRLQDLHCGLNAFTRHMLLNVFQFFISLFSQQGNQSLSNNSFVAKPWVGYVSGALEAHGVILFPGDMERPDRPLGGCDIDIFILNLASLLSPLNLLEPLDDLVHAVAHLEHLLGHAELLLFGLVGVQSEVLFGGKAIRWL